MTEYAPLISYRVITEEGDNPSVTVLFADSAGNETPIKDIKAFRNFADGLTSTSDQKIANDGFEAARYAAGVLEGQN